MLTEIIMPRYSLTMEKGTIIRWLKQLNEAVRKGEPIVEVEADKITTEIEAPASGFLIKILAEEQVEVEVGKTFAYIGNIGEHVPESESYKKSKIEQEKNYGKIDKAVLKIRASPLARRLAKERKIDLSRIQGTGPQGRITKEDVLRINDFKDLREIAEIITLSATQKKIAERMTQSKTEAAHCSITLEIDAARMIKMRQAINLERKKLNTTEISYTDILVKAVANALKGNLILNSSLQGNKIKIFKDINIGIAVEIKKSQISELLVPVIQNADKKSLKQISDESNSLIRRAKEGRASWKDMTGGTFTITNLGMFEIDMFVPIINPPESAILGVGTITDRPTSVKGKIALRPMIKLTLSFDHRFINGAPAARFMQKLKHVLEDEISARD